MTTKRGKGAKKSAAKGSAKRSAKRGSSKKETEVRSAREEQAEADRAQAGASGNEAAIRRSRNEANVAERDAKLAGVEVGEGPREASAAEQKAFGEKYPGQVLGVSGDRKGAKPEAGTTDRAKRQEVVAKHTAGASHGALHVRGDAASGFVDPLPEGARPAGGGSPTLGEHVVGDTEFVGSRGLKVESPKGAEPAFGFVPGKSPESEQRDQAATGNSPAVDRERQRAAVKGAGEIGLLFVVTDVRQNGPADLQPNSTTVILKAAPPGTAETNAKFFAAMPSGTLALNAAHPKYGNQFRVGQTIEVTLKARD